MIDRFDGFSGVLLDSSLKSLAIASIAGCLLLMLRVRDSNLRHRVWLAVLLGMISMPMLSVALPTLDWLPRIGWEDRVTALKVAPPIAAQATSSAGTSRNELFPASAPAISRANPDTFAPTTTMLRAAPAGNFEPAVGVAGVDETDTHPSTNRGDVASIDALLFVLWLIGATFAAIWLAAGAYLARRLLRDSAVLTTSDVAELAVRLPSDIVVRDCPKIRVPVTMGCLHPTIVLPADWMAWDAGKLMAVLAHESAHARRRDTMVMFLADVNRMVFWFHPLAWWLKSKLAEMAESVCDDAVLSETGEPAQYARHLLDVASSVSTTTRAGLPTAVSMARSANVEHRIGWILDASRPLSRGIPPRLRWLLLAIAVVAIGVTASLGPAREPLQDESPPVDAEQDSHAAPLRFAGRVTDSRGNPIEGAKIRFIDWPVLDDRDASKQVVLATTGKEGRFSFEYRVPDDVEPRTDIRFARVLASKPGYGIAITPAAYLESSAKLVDQLTDLERRYFVASGNDDQPQTMVMPDEQHVVQGRILSGEGQPVAGARISVISVSEGKSGTLDLWRKETTLPGANYYSARDKLRQLVSGNFIEGPRATTIPEVFTDNSGKFQLSGLGDHRIAEIIVTGQDIEASRFHVRSEPGEVITLASSSDGRMDEPDTYYPHKFTLVVGATEPVIGRVVDADTGKPVAGVTVKGWRTPRYRVGGARAAQAVSDIADENGEFRLVGLPIGPSELRIEPPAKSNYLLGGVHVTTRAGEAAAMKTIKIKRGVRLTGRVTLAGSGQPVGGYVDYFIMSGNPMVDAVPMLKLGDRRFRHMVDAEGKFEMPVVPGQSIVTFSAHESSRFQRGGGVDAIPFPREDFDSPVFRTYPHFVNAHNCHYLVALDLKAGEQPEPLAIELTAGVSFSGTVVGLDGKPPLRIQVKGQTPFGTWRAKDVGKIEISGYLPAKGRYVAAFDPDTYAIGETMLRGPARPGFSLRLSPGGIFRGRLVDEAGEPMPDMLIHNDTYREEWDDVESRFSVFPTSFDGKPLMTDAQGRFEIAGLLPGKIYSADVLTREEGTSRRIGTIFKEVIATEGVKDLGDVRPDKSRQKTDNSAEVKQGDAKSDDTGSKTPEKADAAVREITIPITVLDPAGKPIQAQLWIGGPPRSGGWNRQPQAVEWSKAGVASADGHAIVLPPENWISRSQSGVDDLQIRVAATARGYGFAWADVPISKLTQGVTLRLATDIPIDGRFVTTEGEPVAGVAVTIADVTAPASIPDSPTLLSSGRGSGIYTNWPAWMGGPPGTETSISDADGRFRMTGMGAERYVRLQARGTGIGDARLSIVTRRPPPQAAAGLIAARKGLAESSYFAEFTHVVVPERVIRGVVVDNESGAPMEGIQVVAPSSWSSRMSAVRTDPAGKFQLTGVPQEKTYQLLLTPVGGDYFRKEITVNDAPSVDAVVVRAEMNSGILLRGKVVDEATGEGVAGTVEYNALFPNPHVDELQEQEIANPLAAIRTDADGEFSIAVLPGFGAIGVRTEARTYSQAWVDPATVRSHFGDSTIDAKPNSLGQYTHFTTAAGGQSRGLMSVTNYQAFQLLNIDRGSQPPKLRLALRCVTRRAGEVLDDQGRPVAGAEVIGLGPHWTSVTRQPLEDHRFTILGLPPGQSRWLVFLHRDRALGAAVKASGDDQDTLRVRLRPTGSAVVRFVDEFGDPLKKIDVEELVPDNLGLYGSGFWQPKSEGSGRYRFDHLIENLGYKLRGRVPQQRYSMPVPAELDVQPGKVVDLGTYRVNQQARFVRADGNGEQ